MFALADVQAEEDVDVAGVDHVQAPPSRSRPALSGRGPVAVRGVPGGADHQVLQVVLLVGVEFLGAAQGVDPGQAGAGLLAPFQAV
ncbi:hypothetical protein ACFV5G_10155 [Streptomyces sp. NPDC059766]|uniref:hypothetical protein n=1 Tax=Streptomyces sp. NPDC059766 TaxID=3346940 RepID=UPI003659E19B